MEALEFCSSFDRVHLGFKFEKNISNAFCFVYRAAGARRRRKKNKEDKKEKQQQHGYLFTYIADRRLTNLSKNKVPSRLNRFNRISSFNQSDILLNSLDATRTSLSTTRDRQTLLTNNHQHPTNAHVSRISFQDKPIEMPKLNGQFLPTNEYANFHTNRLSGRKLSENDDKLTNLPANSEFDSSIRRSMSTRVIHVRISKSPRNEIEQNGRVDDPPPIDPSATHLSKRSSSVGSVSVVRINRKKLMLKKHSISKSAPGNYNNSRCGNVIVTRIHKKSSLK